MKCVYCNDDHFEASAYCTPACKRQDYRRRIERWEEMFGCDAGRYQSKEKRVAA